MTKIMATAAADGIPYNGIPGISSPHAPVALQLWAAAASPSGRKEIIL